MLFLNIESTFLTVVSETSWSIFSRNTRKSSFTNNLANELKPMLAISPSLIFIGLALELMSDLPEMASLSRDKCPDIKSRLSGSSYLSLSNVSWQTFGQSRSAYSPHRFLGDSFQTFKDAINFSAWRPVKQTADETETSRVDNENSGEKEMFLRLHSKCWAIYNRVPHSSSFILSSTTLSFQLFTFLTFYLPRPVRFWICPSYFIILYLKKIQNFPHRQYAIL